MTVIEQGKQAGRIQFDPTINLGHIITVVAFVSGLVIAWQNLDKRVSVLEVRQTAQVRRDEIQDDTLKNSLDAIYIQQRRMEDKIDRVAERVGANERPR